MANNPFKSKVKQPKTDPAVGEIAKTQNKLALEAATLGREQNEWQKELDKYRFDVAKPLIAQQQEVAGTALERGNDAATRYASGYAPLEGLQLYDSLGAGWTSLDAQNQLADRMAQQQIATIDADAASGRISMSEATRQKTAIQQRAATEKTMQGVTKSAEDAASSRAIADTAGGEGRFIAGLTDEAARMGVDPSRVLAGAGAASPAAAAAAAHAGNTARFGFREQQSANLARGVATGRTIDADADQGLGLAVNAGSAAIGNTNATLAGSTAGRTAPATWFGQGQSGLSAASGTYQQQFNNQQARYNNELQRDNGLLDLAGTVAGAAYMASERKVKRRKKPAGTKKAIDAIRDMDVDTWDYKPGKGDGGHHVGPYADDMAELGLSDGKTVHPMDTAGLALAGVKAIIKKLDAMGLEHA